MPLRLEYWRAAPEEFKALLALQQQLRTGVGPRLFDLVFLRVSQINSCLFCIDLHTGELRRAGEPEHRIDALAGWSDAPFFSPAERAALAWAERLTKVRGAEPLDAEFEALRATLSAREIATLTFAISLMNAINRIAIGFGREPQRDATSLRSPVFTAAPTPASQQGN